MGQGRALGQVILRELYDSNYYEWGSILDRFGKAYGLDLVLCYSNGRILAGRNQTLPVQVIDALAHLKKELKRVPNPPYSGEKGSGRGALQDRGRPPAFAPREGGSRPPFRLLPLPPPERLRFSNLLRTSNPTRYWACVSFPFHERRENRPEHLFLLAASSSITGNGLFFNPVPWLLLAGFVLVISILLWIPLVKSITRPIGSITRAAEEIARGNFSVQVDEKRADEVGRLGVAINHMCGQLESLIMGQKRFLGDIAHELASPVARMNLGLGILEQRLKGDDLGHLEDIAEEVRHMSNLINELLSFTRAEIGSESGAAQIVRLGSIIHSVVAREGADGVDIINRAGDDVSVWAVENLLHRALSNVLRNAVRYAGRFGPIEISAHREGEKILLTVADRGPGVPEETIGRLFEPFYRPEAVRDRKSGGVGLGLAIVKTCVQACGGTVKAENLSPKGFAVIMALRASRPAK